jgi:hypothetical protein
MVLTQIAAFTKYSVLQSDKATVDIWIDRSKEGQTHEHTYAVGHTFVFEKGSKTVINQTCHVGLHGQPTKETKEIAVIFEDDLIRLPLKQQSV